MTNMSNMPSSSSSKNQQRYASRPAPPSLPLRSAPRSSISLITVLVNVVVGGVCFYLGNIIGLSSGIHHGSAGCEQALEDVTIDRDRLNKELSKVWQTALHNGVSDSKLHSILQENGNKGPRFPAEVKKLAGGMVLMDRNDFASTFDMGVPVDPTVKENEQVLMLYNRQAALPKNRTLSNDIRLSGDVPVASSALQATENCDYLNIVLTDFKEPRAQCIAIMGQYEAFHIQKFMRLPANGGVLDREAPLQLVNRGAQKNGRKSTKPPLQKHTLQYWETLAPYLEALPDILKRLEPVAKKVAGSKHTVVVMVCNHGQSELLLNFVCSARSRNIDLSHVLLFATDIEMKDLAESLGITVWYDEKTFGSMPKEAARQYADPKFTKMMMAKVYCVQMMAMLPYDFLFQDVDLVWFKDPLTFFHNATHPWHSFDIYFQDDGNHALFYAPYSANTGFYYVRHNDRTQYFFNSMLLSGDLILGTHSHQIALIALLNEHASMYGLKTKILSRDDDDFPGGHHFHNRKPWMREFFRKEHDPYIFHMSWTSSKVNKRKFMEQIGEWFLDDKCASKTLAQIGGNANTCCLAKPDIKCHYRDKPSIVPCRESPPIDKGRASFW